MGRLRFFPCRSNGHLKTIGTLCREGLARPALLCLHKVSANCSDPAPGMPGRQIWQGVGHGGHQCLRFA